MTRKADPKAARPSSDIRKDRLKAALKANLRRRKDQARERKTPDRNKED